MKIFTKGRGDYKAGIEDRKKNGAGGFSRSGGRSKSKGAKSI